MSTPFFHFLCKTYSPLFVQIAHSEFLFVGRIGESVQNTGMICRSRYHYLRRSESVPIFFQLFSTHFNIKLWKVRFFCNFRKKRRLPKETSLCIFHNFCRQPTRPERSIPSVKYF